MGKYKITYSFSGVGEYIIRAENEEKAKESFYNDVISPDEKSCEQKYDYEIDGIEKVGEREPSEL